VFVLPWFVSPLRWRPRCIPSLGQIQDANQQPISIDGLWTLSPGNDGSAGSSQWLYFTAGPNEESHGLFGVLSTVPEPSTCALLLMALAALLGVARKPTKNRSQQNR